MKMIIAALFIVTSSMGFAFDGPYPHPTNNQSLSTGRMIKDVEFIAGQADVALTPCSPEATHPCEMTTELTVAFDIAPCKNALGPVTIETKKDAKGRLDIYVAATRLNFDTTGRMTCHYHVIEKRKFILGMGLLTRGDVQVRFMGTP